MTFLPVYLTGLAVIIGFMTILWLVSLALKNASIVDIFWGAGFVLSAWVYFALTPDGFLPRKLLLVHSGNHLGITTFHAYFHS